MSTDLESLDIQMNMDTLNEIAELLFDDPEFNSLMENRCKELLAEQLEAKCSAKVDGVMAVFLVQDKSNAARGGTEINHGPRVKVQTPPNYVSSKGDPITIPKTKNDSPIHKHGNSENPKKAPETISIVKDIVSRCQSEFNVIWFHPDNPKRQADALKRIIERCPEIVNISVSCDKYPDLEDNLRERIKKHTNK